jgi:hypothetical protein
MQATDKGIDIGSGALHALVAFAGDTEDQARIFFRVKGKKVHAAATSKNFALEIEGTAAEGAQPGEWPVHKKFLADLSKCTTDGSAKVPARIARLIIDREGIKRANFIFRESGEHDGGHDNAEALPPNKQLSFGIIHKTISVDFDVNTGSWFPLHKKQLTALSAVYSAAGKNVPVSFVSGGDHMSPVGFEAKNDDFVLRGILVPPAVLGPGKALVDGDDDDTDDEGDDDDQQPELPGVNAKGGDDAIIEDEEADRIKAAQKHPPLATEKRKAARRKQKNPKPGSR